MLMEPTEAAELLSITTRHLRDLAMAGKIAFINLGTQKRFIMRFHPDDIADFVNGRRVIMRPPALPGCPRKPADVAPFESLDLQEILGRRGAEKRRKREAVLASITPHKKSSSAVPPVHNPLAKTKRKRSTPSD